MPGRDGVTGSIFLEEMPEGAYFKDDVDFRARWDRLMDIRFEITKPLEMARQEKLIGLALDARVGIAAQDENLRGFIHENLEILRDLLIISQIEVVDGGFEIKDSKNCLLWESQEIPGLKVTVEKARGEKCQRCWQWSEQLGEDEVYKDVCPRCARVLHETLPQQDMSK